MDEKIKKQLEQEDPTPFHQRLLEDTRVLMNISRNKMKDYYNVWDHNDDIFRGIKRADKDDKAARERNEPEKMVVPVSYAQITTFVAFCFSLFTQRERIFELVGFTPEDEKPAKVGEALLARDLSHNQFKAKLNQFLLDIGRFGIGILKNTWVTEKQYTKVVNQSPGVAIMGTRIGDGQTTETVEEVVSYQGNKVVNISPYRFFPDTRLPLVRFQEGEFCASEEFYSQSQLKKWENEGVVAGVDFIRPPGNEVTQQRGYRGDEWLLPSSALTVGAGMRGQGQVKRNVVIAEMQRTIIPSQYEIEGEPLGKEDYPIKYVIWMANENRIIKAEPFDYAHNQFTYAVAPFLFDNNVFVSEGLSDVIDQLQNVISWFINSRITNVRKVISNQLIVNSKYVNMGDLEKRSPVIRLLESAPGDLDRVIKQLPLQDVTTNHVGDSKFLKEMVQETTGVNDTLLGQFQPGRRSATEHRNVASGSASRLKTIAAIIYEFGLEQLARQMLSNLRDGLDEAAYVRAVGLPKAQLNPEFIQVTKADLIGRYDFEIFDGTLPSERMYISQALMELVQEFLPNPQAALMLGLDIKKIFYEALVLRGVRNPERFELSREQMLQMQLAQQTQQKNGQPTNKPSNGNGTANSGVSGVTPESILPLLTGAGGGRT